MGKNAEPEDPISPPSLALVLLSANLKRLMAANPEKGTDGKLAKAMGTYQKAIWRVVNRAHEPGVDVVSALAKAFGLEVWQLFVPDLEPTAPPELLDRSDRAWPFPGLPHSAFEGLSPEQKIEIQGVIRKMINDFKAPPSPGEQQSKPPRAA